MVFPGSCTGCGAPCCREHLITVTSFDVSRIAANNRRNPREFALLHPASILNLDEDTVLECYEGDFRSDFILALNSHPCVFLGENKLCTIHDFAPYNCRTYPFNSAGGMLARSRCGALRLCGFRLSGPSISAGEFSSQLKEYKELVRKWNRLKGTREECWAFLFGRCKKRE
jgi:Fe-S-cluster containining protein